MSHFAVLVIGDNVEGQLAPFHEFECTGTEDKHVQTIEQTQEARETFAKSGEPGQTFVDFVEGWYGAHPVPHGEKPDLEGDHKFGYATLDAEGEVVGVFDRTNPDKKWDWWVVGGRWTGFFTLKHGASGSLGRPGLLTDDAPANTADAVRKGDVDFEAMRRTAADEAGKRWDEVRTVAPATWESWVSVRERMGEDRRDEARGFYNDQPSIIAINTSDLRMFMIDDALAGSREEYVQAARNSAGLTYAVVRDSQWIARGEMGWFGMSSDDVSEADWAEKVSKMLDELPDDTMLTVVDCHI